MSVDAQKLLRNIPDQATRNALSLIFAAITAFDQHTHLYVGTGSDPVATSAPSNVSSTISLLPSQVFSLP